MFFLFRIAPIRSVRGQELPKQASLEDLIPRLDISPMITPKLLKNLGDEV